MTDVGFVLLMTGIAAVTAYAMYFIILDTLEGLREMREYDRETDERLKELEERGKLR